MQSTTWRLKKPSIYKHYSLGLFALKKKMKQKPSNKERKINNT